MASVATQSDEPCGRSGHPLSSRSSPLATDDASAGEIREVLVPWLPRPLRVRQRSHLSRPRQSRAGEPQARFDRGREETRRAGSDHPVQAPPVYPTTLKLTVLAGLIPSPSADTVRWIGLWATGTGGERLQTRGQLNLLTPRDDCRKAGRRCRRSDAVYRLARKTPNLLKEDSICLTNN